jgi:glutamyl-tRNA synthetase
MTITRFSPSPTGYLHLGNVRTALINFLFTQNRKGKLILRMDDTDFTRSKEEYTDGIKEDLTWLGIKWDEFAKQSDNLDRYEEVRKKLESEGKIYPCFESEEELQMQRKIQTSRGIPPIYERGSLNLTKEQIQEKIDQGIKPYYRFLLNDEPTTWKDGVRGEINFTSRSFSDPVVVRTNGAPTYTFCSVIDDIDHKITDIIRGEDHITNTAVQIQIFKSLTKKLPKFYHLSLLKTKTQEMSKRVGGFEIKSLREEGVDPMAINSFLANLGTSNNITAHTKMEDLYNHFSFQKFSHGAVNYMQEDLLNLNHKLLAKRELSQIKPFLDDLKIGEISNDFWDLVKANIDNYKEIPKWQEIFEDDYKITPQESEKDFLKTAADLLPKEITSENFKDWVKEISVKTGKKGKELYHPLRLAITNYDSGPELSKITMLLGSEKVRQRLCQ